MSLLVAEDKYVITAKDLLVDVYHNTNHKIIKIPVVKASEQDYISDIAISEDCSYLAVVTASSKQLIVYDLPQLQQQQLFIIPRNASRIRFTVDTKLLVADKSGDVLMYDINKENSGSKLLGHLSLLLDVLQTNDTKHIITCDRDEKIRVSCYPNTYIIQNYCLGHKEFVNHIELLPHNDKFLTSSSGDGTIKIWDFINGKNFHTIDTSLDVKDDQLKQKFINIMDEGGIEVNTLPIVHYTTSKLNESTSIMAATIHSFNSILIYSISIMDCKAIHKMEQKLELDYFPSGIRLHDNKLYVYQDSASSITVYDLVESEGMITFVEINKIKMFENENVDSESKESPLESIKVLYKRKFDNVQEYQERKKQRLEKSLK